MGTKADWATICAQGRRHAAEQRIVALVETMREIEVGPLSTEHDIFSTTREFPCNLLKIHWHARQLCCARSRSGLHLSTTAQRAASTAVCIGSGSPEAAPKLCCSSCFRSSSAMALQCQSQLPTADTSTPHNVPHRTSYYGVQTGSPFPACHSAQTETTSSHVT